MKNITLYLITTNRFSDIRFLLINSINVASVFGQTCFYSPSEYVNLTTSN